jgi:hypothetical protein
VPGRSAVVTGLTVAGTAGIVAAIPGWFFSDLDPLSPLAAWRRERAARLTAAFAAALREVGSRLQFRHARLQDRLAASALRLPPAAASRRASTGDADVPRRARHPSGPYRR